MPKTKAKKDPNKPKGAKTAFMFFVESERARRPGESFKFGEFTKVCGEMWKDMSEEDKMPYQRKSDQDRMRYQREMESYSAPESDSDSDDERPKKKKKKVKDKNAPKRAMSAFFHFGASERPKIRLLHPDWKITEVASELGNRWRSVSEEDKKPFQELAAQDKLRYEREMQDYNKRLIEA